MISFVLLSLPVFAVAGVGFFGARSGLIGEVALDALGSFSFRFALPALVLRLIAAQPLDRTFNPSFFAAYLGSGGLVFVSVFLFTVIVSRVSVPVAGARSTAAAFSNLGFLGPPLLLTYFGDRGAGPLAMAIMSEVMIIFSVGSTLMGSGQSGGRNIRLAVLRGIVLNPVLIAILMGAAFAAAGVRIPTSLDRFLELLGGAAAPTALFALGGSLALQKLDGDTILTATALSLAKLVLYPVVAWCALTLLFGAGDFWLRAGVLLACLPSASSNYVAAQRFATEPDVVSAAITISTISSIITVPIAVWMISG